MFIRQRQKDDCGVCAVAMAAGVDYETALWAVFPTRPNVVRLTWKTRPEDLRRGLTKLGRITSPKITPVRHWEISHEAIIAIGDYHSSDFHWVYYDNIAVYDPSLDEAMMTDDYYWPPSGMLIVRPG